MLQCFPPFVRSPSPTANTPHTFNVLACVNEFNELRRQSALLPSNIANRTRFGNKEIISRLDARLVRDPVDPLQLRLTCLLHSRNTLHPLSSSLQTPPIERWTFCICMPRMYPHAPPTITRVTRDIVPNNENMAHLGNVNLDYHTNSNSASAAILASSAMQHHNMFDTASPSNLTTIGVS